MTATTQFVNLLSYTNNDNLRPRDKEYKFARVTLALGLQDDTGDFSLRSLNIEEVVQRHFCALVRKNLLRISRKYAKNELELCQFDIGKEQEPHHFEWLKSDSEYLAPVLDLFPAQFTNIRYLDLAELQDKKIIFYAIGFEFTNRAERFVVFRKSSRSKNLLQSNNFFLRGTGERYDRLREPTFQFDDGMDAIVFREHAYMISRHNAFSIFDFDAVIERQARVALDLIKAAVTIEGNNEFEADCIQHPIRRTMLVKMFSRGHLPTLTLDKIKANIAKNRIDIRMKRSGNNERIVYEKAKIWDLLSVLDDAYVISEMTMNRYKAPSRSRIR